MAPSSSTQTLSELVGDTTALSQGLSSFSGIMGLVEKETQLLSGQKVNTTDLYPLNCKGGPVHYVLAGDQDIEIGFHKAMKQGAFLETSMGEAMAWVEKRKADLERTIEHYFDLNKLAVDGKLPTGARSPKYAADTITFLKKIRQYTVDVMTMVQVIQANLSMVQSMENQMISMIQANLNCVANLLREICNWGIPPLPSMLAQLGSMWRWAGFNFNSISGFNFVPNVNFNFSFSFSQCSLRTPNLAAFFNSGSSSVADDNVAISMAQPQLPAGAVYADPSQFTVGNYLQTLRATLTPVFNPITIVASSVSSLPNPVSIVSNYSLPPASYAANVVSAVPSLASVVVQPGGTPQENELRSLCVSFLTLGQIFASNYDPNLMAAWIFYLNLNRAGRAGNWLPGMQAEYDALITPSLAYLNSTPVPWNEDLTNPDNPVLHNAPVAIPLIATLQADKTNNLLWRLSYVEAALLGYTRNTTWDSAADSTFLASFTSADFDYVPTSFATTPTASVVLGEGTATMPVTATFPLAISGVLNEVIATAAANIAATPSFQSVHPQFRYIYNMFAEASLVDRFTQFWREFNANLVTLLAQDPYITDFVMTYPALLDSAIDPLGSPSLYSTLTADAGARNRSWTPGSDLLPIPTAIELGVDATPPTDTTNGWTGGAFNAAAYLARPDVQAQSIPVQIAMLRTNQSYAKLMTAQSLLQFHVADMAANAQSIIQTAGASGWETETSAVVLVPTGSLLTVQFAQTIFDYTGFVQADQQTIQAAQAGTYAVAVVLNWDPTGDAGSRSVSITLNGVTLTSATVSASDSTPFTSQLSFEVELSVGDELTVTASHDLSTAQSVLVGSNFIGLMNSTGSAAPQVASSTFGGLSLISESALPAFTAVAIDGSGKLVAVNPMVSTTGPAPVISGVTLADVAAGGSVTVAMGYGNPYEAPGQGWTPGGLLYLTPQAGITQDFATVSTSGGWIICVGQAITQDSFVFAPHAPSIPA